MLTVKNSHSFSTEISNKNQHKRNVVWIGTLICCGLIDWYQTKGLGKNIFAFQMDSDNNSLTFGNMKRAFISECITAEKIKYFPDALPGAYFFTYQHEHFSPFCPWIVEVPFSSGLLDSTSCLVLRTRRWKQSLSCRETFPHPAWWALQIQIWWKLETFAKI